MGKSIAGVLMKDANSDYFMSLIDPATGLTYAPRAVNLNTASTGDYADPTAVLYGPNGNPLLPAAAALGDADANPTTARIGAELQVYDRSAQQWVRASAVSNNGTDFQIGAATPQAAFQPLVYDATNFKVISSARQAADGADGSFAPTSAPILFNGATFDRQYSYRQGTLLASAARTSAAQTANQSSFGLKNLLLFLNVTVASGTGGLTLRLYAVDPASGNNVQINAEPTVITATGLYGYMIGAGASAAGVTGTTHVQQFTASPAPATWFAYVAANDSSSYTYSLGYQEF